MVTKLLPLAVILASAVAHAQDEAAAKIWVTDTANEIDQAFVISFPTGPSDYFSVAHRVEPGVQNSRELVDGLPVSMLAVSIADFGSHRTFPRLGLYLPQLSLDPTGKTPDLHRPIVELTSPANPAPPLFAYVAFDAPEAAIPAGTTSAVAAVQLPPGDSGLLGVGYDDVFYYQLTSGSSTNAYATPARIMSDSELGINVGQDNGATMSCKVADRSGQGRLRIASGVVGSGDRLEHVTRPADQFTLAFFGAMLGDRFRLYAADDACVSLTPVGPVFTTVGDADGDGSYRRLAVTWPDLCIRSGSYRFAAAWGNPSCPNPGAGFTNCVTVTLSEPEWGIGDDNVDVGWVVQIPSGSSDYFNNSFGPPDDCVHNLTGLVIAPLDFGTAVAAYPTSGVSNPNLVVDGTGNTPDLAGPGLLALVAPFTFPPGTFASTSGQYIEHAISVPRSALGSDVHAWVQFPPGDPGLLGVGADSAWVNPDVLSLFTTDGYATPASSFFVMWCIRIMHD